MEVLPLLFGSRLGRQDGPRVEVEQGIFGVRPAREDQALARRGPEPDRVPDLEVERLGTQVKDGQRLQHPGVGHRHRGACHTLAGGQIALGNGEPQRGAVLRDDRRRSAVHLDGVRSDVVQSIPSEDHLVAGGDGGDRGQAVHDRPGGGHGYCCRPGHRVAGGDRHRRRARTREPENGTRPEAAHHRQ